MCIWKYNIPLLFWSRPWHQLEQFCHGTIPSNTRNKINTTVWCCLFYHISKKKIFIDMKFKFQKRNIMYYKKAIKYFFQIYKSYLFLFICAWHCKSCGTLLTNQEGLLSKMNTLGLFYSSKLFRVLSNLNEPNSFTKIIKFL